MNVHAYLEHYTLGALKMMSLRRGLPYLGINKADQIRLLAPVLFDRRWIRKHLDACPEAARLALEIVRHAGRKMSGRQLALALLDEHADAHATIRELIAQALLLYSEEEAAGASTRLELWAAYRASDHDSELWLPPEVEEALGPARKPAARPPADLETYAGQLTPVRRPIADAVRCIYTLVQEIRSRPLGCTLGGPIRKADIARLNKALAPAEPLTHAGSLEAANRTDLLFHLSSAVGIVTGDERTFSVDEAKLGFFSATPAEQVRQLLDAWREHSSWNELCRAEGVYVDSASDDRDLPDYRKLTLARERILGTIAVPLAASEWVSLASVCRHIQQHHVDFLFSRKRPRGHFGRSDDIPYGGLRPAGKEYDWQAILDKRRDWDVVEGGFIRALIAETLLWLGAVEIGTDDNGRAVAFRLTPEGAVALGVDTGVAAPATEAARALVVQPNFEMVLLPDVAGFGVAIELDRFADRATVDRAIVYRLTRESIYRGLREGVRIEEVLARLEELSRSALPQNVRHSLGEWGRQFAGLRLRRSASILAGSTAEELAGALTRTRQDSAPLSPTAALLTGPPEGLQRLLRQPGVRACDYRAAISDIASIDEDGRIRVPVERLTPLIRYRLEALARPGDQEGEFVLDRERLRAAVGAGASAADLEAFLDAAAIGDIPADVRLKVRGWSGSAPEIAVMPAAAVGAPADLLDLVMQLPWFQASILGRPSPTLVLVDAAHAAEARQALVERGLCVQEGSLPQMALPTPPPAPAEAMQVLPTRETRLFLERAIAEKRDVVVAYLRWNADKVVVYRATPRVLAKRGNQYHVQVVCPESPKEFLEVRRIQAIRLA